MAKNEIDKTAICELSKLFATKTNCCGNKTKFDCENCQYDWDCMTMEIARQVNAMGYVKAKTHNKSNNQIVEETAKEIARVRGYGCDKQDSCSKCICAYMLDCIPLQLANCMVAAGYEKKEG